MENFQEKVSDILNDKIITNIQLLIFFTHGLKTESSGIYFKGLLLKEETTNIKGLNQEVLNDFKASGKWLGKWKLSYGKCEKQISGSLVTFLRLAINLP